MRTIEDLHREAVQRKEAYLEATKHAEAAARVASQRHGEFQWAMGELFAPISLPLSALKGYPFDLVKAKLELPEGVELHNSKRGHPRSASDVTANFGNKVFIFNLPFDHAALLGSVAQFLAEYKEEDSVLLARRQQVNQINKRILELQKRIEQIEAASPEELQDLELLKVDQP